MQTLMRVMRKRSAEDTQGRLESMGVSFQRKTHSSLFLQVIQNTSAGFKLLSSKGC